MPGYSVLYPDKYQFVTGYRFSFIRFFIPRLYPSIDLHHPTSRISFTTSSPTSPERARTFEPTVYFLGHVREAEDRQQGVVHKMNDEVTLPEKYIKYFVLAEWDLSDEQLKIRFERREEDEDQ